MLRLMDDVDKTLQSLCTSSPSGDSVNPLVINNPEVVM